MYVPQTPLFSIFRITIKRDYESQRVVSSQLQQSSTGFPARPQLGIRIQPLGHTWDRYESPQTGQTIEDRLCRNHGTLLLWPRSSAPVLGAVLVGVFIGALPRSLRGHLGSEEMGKWPESCKCVHVPVRNRHCHQARRRAQHVAREQAGETKRPGPRRTRRVKFTPPCVL